MPRRNVIPLVLLAVLGVLTALFAALAVSASPGSATVTVQNASGATFGSPTGAASFSMNLINTLSSGPNTGTLTQARLIDYVPPDRMAVYQAGPRRTLLAVLSPAAVTCALSGYGTIVGGTTPWTAEGTGFGRTESLMTYSARVPHPVGRTCEPKPTPVHGQVFETAVVKGGYLVNLHLTIVVPPQTLDDGTQAAHGIEGETLQLLQVNGTPTSALG
jgi:hypothetical protein